MVRNIILIFRNLRKNGIYSIINIIGLCVSLAACVFIVLWIQDERSYDRFHKSAENIYMAVTHYTITTANSDSPRSTGGFAPTAKEDFAHVEDFCRMMQSELNYLAYEDIKSSSVKSYFADPNFFGFFNFPIVAGDRENPLQKPESVVISERLAIMLFGAEDPVGKSISTEGGGKMTVTAVMKNMPRNTYLTHVDLVRSLSVIQAEFVNNWLNNNFFSFIRITPGSDVRFICEKVAEKLPPERSNFVTYSLHPLVNMHLYTIKGEPAGIKTVRMFQWVAIVILLIACINYVNLVTARASKRYREIGLRKVHGAEWSQLFMQLISESAVVFIIAILFALALNHLLLPFFNSLSGKEFVLGLFDRNVWGIYSAMFVAVVVLAGIYPAILSSSFKASNFAGKVRLKQGSAVFRKMLVVAQFIASAVLIAGTITLWLQMKYMREKDFGYHREQVLMCNLLNMRKSSDVVKAELERNPSIIGASVASGNIMNVTSLYGFGPWEGKIHEEGDLHNFLYVDSAFVRVMGLTLLSGSNFTSTNSAQYMINESLVKSMRITDNPVGKWVNGDKDQIIVAVVKNFHFESLHKEIGPLALYHRPQFPGMMLYIRVSPGNIPQAISALKKLWEQYNPDYAFDYWFLDDTFNTMYKAEIQTNKLFGVFSLIAILISCLGLFGLVVYTAELKTKDIGIRKVHGASIPDIVALLLRDFLILVGIAILIATPLSYYLVNKMLMDFAYRISLSWWIFAFSGLITIALTLLTVCWIAIKAATKNPIQAIMTE